MLQKCFSIGNILVYQRKLKKIYNRKHFLRVLYFFLNKICSTCCNNGNWFVSAEITLIHSCSSNLILQILLYTPRTWRNLKRTKQNGSIDECSRKVKLSANSKFELICILKVHSCRYENLAIHLSLYKNRIMQIALYNTFYFLRYANFRFAKCLFTNIQKQ